MSMEDVAFDVDGYGAEIAPHHIFDVKTFLPDKLTLASNCSQKDADRFATSLDEFACLSLSNYESASGMAIFVSRNFHGLLRSDVGKPLPDDPSTRVTGAMVDSGLNAVHAALTAEGPFVAKQPQLRRHRHADGNNCVWRVQGNRRLHSVATKKVMRTIASVGLRLRIFEVNHKCAMTDLSVLVGILPLAMESPLDGYSTSILHLDSSLMALALLRP